MMKKMVLIITMLVSMIGMMILLESLFVLVMEKFTDKCLL